MKDYFIIAFACDRQSPVPVRQNGAILTILVLSSSRPSSERGVAIDASNGYILV